MEEVSSVDIVGEMAYSLGMGDSITCCWFWCARPVLAGVFALGNVA